jgi:DNA polymerase-3 subunit gamma/tau
MGGGGGGAMAMLRAVPDAPPVAVAAVPAPQMVAPQIAEPPEPEPTPFVAMPASFREVISLVRELKELTLYGHLLHSVHLVRFAAPVIEIRPRPEAPRDVSSRLAGLLQEATGQRWTIAISTASGEPTIDEQRTAADNQREQEASAHPLVRAIMDAFPGAQIENVRDPMVDEYRLPPTAATDDQNADADMAPGAGALLPDDLPDFAPPDAELLDDTDMEIE